MSSYCEPSWIQSPYRRSEHAILSALMSYRTHLCLCHQTHMSSWTGHTHVKTLMFSWMNSWQNKSMSTHSYLKKNIGNALNLNHLESLRFSEFSPNNGNSHWLKFRVKTYNQTSLRWMSIVWISSDVPASKALVPLARSYKWSNSLPDNINRSGQM